MRIINNGDIQQYSDHQPKGDDKQYANHQPIGNDQNKMPSLLSAPPESSHQPQLISRRVIFENKDDQDNSDDQNNEGTNHLNRSAIPMSVLMPELKPV